MSNLRDSLLGCVDKILGVKDSMGANIHEVFIINRVWTGERVGDGSFTDEESQVLPTPCIKDYSHDVRITESGAVKQGDIILTGLSRNVFPDEEEFKTKTEERNTQRMFKVGTHFYHVKHIKEKLITWDLHLTKIRQDETEER